MTVCLNCKYATWERTSKGRLHPGGEGTCSWTQTVKVPGHHRPNFHGDMGDPITICNGRATIWRGDYGISRCDVFEEAGA